MAVTVFASFTPKEGAAAEVERLLRGMIAPTRAEPGNLRYDLYRGAGAATFHFFEIYVDAAALDAHRASAHYQAYRAQIGEYLAAPIGVALLEGLDTI